MRYLYLLFLLVLISCNTEPLNYVKYVDVLIGTGPSTTQSVKGQSDPRPHGQTIPAISAPFGMTQWTPQIQNFEKPCLAPFYHRGTILQGFRASHWLNGSCDKDYGSFGIFATTNKDFKYLPDQRNALYLLNTDKLSPAYAVTMFAELGIMAEMTATKRCGMFRFSWLDTKEPAIVLDVNNDDGEGYIKVDIEKQEVYGYNPVKRSYSGDGQPAGISGYFVAKFDKPFSRFGTYGNNSYKEGFAERQNQSKIGAYVVFEIQEKESIKMKIGTSFTGIDNARINLNTEISNWDFEGTKEKLENDWNEILGRIEVETTSEDELTKFYTAMYHALLYPRLYSDINGDYPAFSQQYQIKNTKEFNYYGDFSLHSTAHAQMPLLSLIAPKEYNDMIKSLLAMALEGDRLPGTPLWNNYTGSTTGDYGSALLADAAMKGFDFDLDLAFKLMLKNATEIPTDNELSEGKGRKALDSYIQFGYVPIDVEPENQVSSTLEYAYNDWCVAQLAKILADNENYKNLISRAYSYSNVFDDIRGWMNGRLADGTFTDDFYLNKEQEFFSGSTAHRYSWYVPHDIPGLIELFGGEEDFSNRLDDLVNTKYYLHADVTNNHLPYLYNYIGAWDKTQQAVKSILKSNYDLGPGGLSGFDQAGQLSAWYVFSSMGFYPVCPGSNEYQLASPLFQKVILHLDKDFYDGEKFVLQSDEKAGSSNYTKIRLNGKDHSTSITHNAITNGGELIFSAED